MVSHNANQNKASRAAPLAGAMLAVAALIGASIVGQPGAARATRHAPAAIQTTTVASINLFEAPGILLIAGATVLLIAFLQRQALRERVISRPLLRIRALRPQTSRDPQARRCSISHHVGGLHGP